MDDLTQQIRDVLQEHPKWGRKRVADELDTTESAVRSRLMILRGLRAPPGTIGATQEQRAPSLVQIDGVTPDDHMPDPETIWARLIGEQGSVEERVTRRYSQAITIPDSRPVGLAFLSDLHLGNSFCDYRAIRGDAQTVAATDGMYALASGDYMDNWVGKLEGMQRYQKCDFDAELVLAESWFDTLGPSLIAVCAGNHDNRTRKIAGIDYVRRLLKGRPLLYDRHEIGFTLRLGDECEKRVKLRHKWKWASVFNPTHGIEADEQRGDMEFDIGIGGHTHIGTLFRDFVYKTVKRVAVLVGTYKMYDGYGAECGYPRSYGTGCGVLILHPDGTMEAQPNVDRAAAYLEYLRR